MDDDYICVSELSDMCSFDNDFFWTYGLYRPAGVIVHDTAGIPQAHRLVRGRLHSFRTGLYLSTRNERIND